MESNNKNGFTYTYSAKEQEELKKIREKYISKEEDKMERLRRLDTSVTRRAQAVALTLGVIGTLVLGFGLSLVLLEPGALLPDLPTHAILPLGISLGLLGCVPICLAYPIYGLIVKRERKRIAPEILRLTDELLK